MRNARVSASSSSRNRSLNAWQKIAIAQPIHSDLGERYPRFAVRYTGVCTEPLISDRELIIVEAEVVGGAGHRVILRIVQQVRERPGVARSRRMVRHRRRNYLAGTSCS